jgi:hypothetical protein
MYSRHYVYFDWKPQVDTKTISRPTARCCIKSSPSRSGPETPELECRGLRHSVGFYCQTHAKTQLNDIPVISVTCPAITENLTQEHHPAVLIELAPIVTDPILPFRKSSKLFQRRISARRIAQISKRPQYNSNFPNTSAAGLAYSDTWFLWYAKELVSASFALEVWVSFSSLTRRSCETDGCAFAVSREPEPH